MPRKVAAHWHLGIFGRQMDLPFSITPLPILALPSYPNEVPAMRSNYLNNYRFISVFFALMAGFTNLPYASAEPCSDQRVALADRPSWSQVELLAGISNALKRSVILESRLRPGVAETFQIPPAEGTKSLSELVAILDTNHHLACSIDGEVIHIYDPEVLAARENALNHTFRGFAVPNSAELFALALRIRLTHEAFQPADAEMHSGSTGGALPSDASSARLPPEVVRDISARDLFIREGRIVPMVMLVKVPPDGSAGSLESWKKTSSSMVVKITR